MSKSSMEIFLRKNTKMVNVFMLPVPTVEAVTLVIEPEYTYFEAELDDEPTNSLPGPKNDNTINAGTFSEMSY